MNLYVLQVWSNVDEVWKTFYVSSLLDDANEGFDTVDGILDDRLFRVVEFSYDSLNFLGTYTKDCKIIRGHRAGA